MIELVEIGFTYHQKPVLTSLSLVIPDHAYIGVAGENGSGKSTFGRLVAGILRPGQGEIRVDGQPVTHRNFGALRTRVGYVFSDPNQQFLGTTVADDLAFGLEAHQVPHAEMDARIQEVAARCGITHLLDRSAATLSGGEKQRVAIAAILILRPEVLIFDEATAMLDPTNKRLIRDLMRSLHAEGKTVIEITHDLNDLLDAERVLWFADGRLIFDDQPTELIHLPATCPLPMATEFVRMLLTANLRAPATSSLTEIIRALPVPRKAPGENEPNGE